MDIEIYANRGRLVRNISYEDIPKKCILEILKCHGKEVDEHKFWTNDKYCRKCFNVVSQLEDFTIDFNRKKDISRLVRYIQPAGGFSDKTLIRRSANRIHRIAMDTEDVYVTHCNPRPLTQENPLGLNIDMMICLATRRGIQIRNSYDENTLYNLLLWSETPREKIQTQIYRIVSKLNSSEMIHKFYPVFIHNSPSGANEPIQSEEMPSSDVLFPRFDQEAIIMSMINYKLDIRNAKNPMKVYHDLLSRNELRDENLLIELRKDSKALDLKQRFRIGIPEKFYETDDLKKMAYEEGFSFETDKRTPYEFLTQFHTDVINTFYAYDKGPAHNRDAFNSYLLTTGDSIHIQPPLGLLYWGSLQTNEKLFVVSYHELLTTFKVYNCLRNPLVEGFQLFSDVMIRKLKILSQKPCADEGIHNVRMELYRLIHILEKRQQGMIHTIHTIRNHTQVEHMKWILKLGMACRSAKSMDPFPYEIGNLSEDETQLLISNMLLEYNNKFLHDSSFQETVKLPLVQYVTNTKSFIVNEDVYDGKTIDDRIRIMMKGDSARDMSSCIRLCSNWLCHTAYYYIVSEGVEPPFNIDMLCRIG